MVEIYLYFISEENVESLLAGNSGFVARVFFSGNLSKTNLEVGWAPAMISTAHVHTYLCTKVQNALLYELWTRFVCLCPETSLTSRTECHWHLSPVWVPSTCVYIVPVKNKIKTLINLSANEMIWVVLVFASYKSVQGSTAAMSRVCVDVCKILTRLHLAYILDGLFNVGHS